MNYLHFNYWHNEVNTKHAMQYNTIYYDMLRLTPLPLRRVNYRSGRVAWYILYFGTWSISVLAQINPILCAVTSNSLNYNTTNHKHQYGIACWFYKNCFALTTSCNSIPEDLSWCADKAFFEFWHRALWTHTIYLLEKSIMQQQTSTRHVTPNVISSILGHCAWDCAYDIHKPHWGPTKLANSDHHA